MQVSPFEQDFLAFTSTTIINSHLIHRNQKAYQIQSHLGETSFVLFVPHGIFTVFVDPFVLSSCVLFVCFFYFFFKQTQRYNRQSTTSDTFYILFTIHLSFCPCRQLSGVSRFLATEPSSSLNRYHEIPCRRNRIIGCCRATSCEQ